MTIEEQIGAKIRDLRNQNGRLRKNLPTERNNKRIYFSIREGSYGTIGIHAVDIVECLGTNCWIFFMRKMMLQVVYRKEDYFEKKKMSDKSRLNG